MPARKKAELPDMPDAFQSVVLSFANDSSVTVGAEWGHSIVVLERVDDFVSNGMGRRLDPRYDGRFMKEWLVVGAAAARQWPSLARKALAFARAAVVLGKRRVR